MGKTPDDEYREKLKKKLTEKPPSENTTYYSRTGFRKQPNKPEPVRGPVYYRPRRRIGLVLMLPLLLLFMISGRLQGIVIPLVLAVLLYLWIKRTR